MDPHRLANEDANRTRYAITATVALHGDWEPLMQWMAEVTVCGFHLWIKFVSDRLMTLSIWSFA